jgi:hypothetical protein
MHGIIGHELCMDLRAMWMLYEQKPYYFATTSVLQTASHSDTNDTKMDNVLHVNQHHMYGIGIS